MTYLADSDVLIDALNGQREAIELFARLRQASVFISVISLGEIYDGALGARDPRQHVADAKGFLTPYPVLQLSDAIMLQFAQLRRDLRLRGRPIPDFDIAIAATTLVNELVLITRNRRHFDRIPSLRLYDVQW